MKNLINYQLLGENLKIQRETSGVTQEELCDCCNISKSHYSAMENGKAKPSLDKILRIVNFYGIPVSPLLTDEYVLGDIPANLHESLCEMTNEQRVSLLNLLSIIAGRDSVYDSEKRNVGYRIRKYRRQRDLKPDMFSDICGISSDSYKNIESGNAMIKFESLKAVSDFSHFPVDVFLIDYINNNLIAIEYLIKDLDINKILADRKLSLIVYCYIDYILKR